MTQKITGQVDWGTNPPGTESSGGNNLFVRLKEGSNIVRILSQKPWLTWVHWLYNDKGELVKVRCSTKDDCPACARAKSADTPDKQKRAAAAPKWLVQVIDRDSNECAMLEMPPLIKGQIEEIAAKTAWGAPYMYDVDISRKPKKSNPLYLTTPLGKTPLTDQEKAMATEFVNRKTKAGELLVKVLTRPMTNEEIIAKLRGDDSKKEVANPGATAFDSASQSAVTNTFTPPPTQVQAAAPVSNQNIDESGDINLDFLKDT